MKQWQESLEMIVKRLQLSELHNKIMEEVNTFEINLDRMTSDLNQPQQLFGIYISAAPLMVFSMVGELDNIHRASELAL